MHPSGEVGRVQMDNLSSPPGDWRHSAPFLKRRVKQARLFCDRAISTLIFDEREMESLARPSVIVRVAAAFWTAGARLFNSRRLCVPSFGSKACLGQEHKGDFQKECCTNL
jgi:hypothetical protein